MRKPLSIIVATEQTGGIGINNSIPWKIQRDILFFRNKTTYTSSPDKVNAVIMGRKTWDSLPNPPLRKRLNIVISTTRVNKKTDEDSDEMYFSTFEKAVKYCDESLSVESMFVIGGEQLYNYCMKNMLHRLDAVYWTMINRVFERCDCFFSPSREFFRIFSTVNLEEDLEGEFRILKYER